MQMWASACEYECVWVLWVCTSVGVHKCVYECEYVKVRLNVIFDWRGHCLQSGAEDGGCGGATAWPKDDPRTSPQEPQEYVQGESVSMCKCECVNMCNCECIWVWLHVSMCTSVVTCTSLCICVCGVPMHVFVCMYICAYVYTYSMNTRNLHSSRITIIENIKIQN